MTFDYDWWFRTAYADRVAEAKLRCAMARYPELDREKGPKDRRQKTFLKDLEARTILYLRDGFSYEVKSLIEMPCTSSLTFECAPADEAYKVGCFVVTVPFEDIVRVEIFAVHPHEKPEDMPSIKGFGSAHPPAGPVREDRGQRSGETAEARIRNGE